MGIWPTCSKTGRFSDFVVYDHPNCKLQPPNLVFLFVTSLFRKKIVYKFLCLHGNLEPEGVSVFDLNDKTSSSLSYLILSLSLLNWSAFYASLYQDSQKLVVNPHFALCYLFNSRAWLHNLLNTFYKTSGTESTRSKFQLLAKKALSLFVSNKSPCSMKWHLPS